MTTMATTTGRAKQLVGGRTRNKDKRYRNFTTKGVTIKNHSKNSSSTDRNMPAQAQPQPQDKHNKTKTRTNNKKKISRLVITGLKKPLKLMSHSVKSSLISRGPKRILAITANNTPRGHGGYYEY